jgi:transcriptional regulator with XRE-family HTH domain
MAKKSVPPDQIDAYTGDMIKKIREKKGFAPDEFARKIGVSTRQLQKYESGTTSVPIMRMFHVARELGVSVRTLLPDTIDE